MRRAIVARCPRGRELHCRRQVIRRHSHGTFRTRPGYNPARQSDPRCAMNGALRVLVRPAVDAGNRNAGRVASLPSLSLPSPARVDCVDCHNGPVLAHQLPANIHRGIPSHRGRSQDDEFPKGSQWARGEMRCPKRGICRSSSEKEKKESVKSHDQCIGNTPMYEKKKSCRALKNLHIKPSHRKRGTKTKERPFTTEFHR
ncbi:hypothetical protein BDV28DRAFT_36802 [Aspergillus coremiiformis]|uniref:Uncharacterized protein n=1 Tax=Aspergillus coremiiformis TaxID=138285 RepID=A0A5N6YYN6_9EURO|nr:hypothetical protein BDV28DRAFT_36802 [Aspergillus coremiiformis]